MPTTSSGTTNTSYRKKTGSDLWHFCANCPNWPELDFEEQSAAVPALENLCGDCREKKGRGECQSLRLTSPQRPKKILLIEDHADVRRVLSLALRRLGYETAEAGDAVVGIEMSVAEHPDLILMDISLPDSSGLQTARKIKENPKTTRIPIVACSGWQNEEIMAQAADAGIAEFLLKPISLDALVKAIERVT